MSKLKGKVSLLLALVMMMMTILPVANVFAANDVGEQRIMTLSASYKGSNLADKSTITIKPTETNRTITFTLSNFKNGSGNSVNPDMSTADIAYVWDNGSIETASKASKTATITIPNFAAGKHSVLQVEGLIKDNSTGCVGQSNILTIYVNVPSATTVSTTVKNGSTTLSTGKTYTIPTGTNLSLSASTNDNGGMALLAYQWDGNDLYTVNNPNQVATITIPESFLPGSTHTLEVGGKTADGTVAPVAKYTITIPKADEEPKNVDDDLIVEPWMKENKNLDNLSVSLRNEPENEKANKNIYALNEKVTYYVDYKNGGNKTKKNVKLVLELPLDVTVVDADGGTVNGKTITWNFPEGLDEDESGTKVVAVKYISLGKSSVKSKIVYPVADIYEGSKVIDSSAVINLIYKDSKTEIIDDEHYPYMHGDAEADTFRPDDGITRAEGALVLTRIFGMNTSGVQITNLYPDLGETYVEAQKAIVAATKVGLINGYTDGTYRPNEKMTRAEFMKIIAGNIELAAKDNDLDDNVIDGLRVRTSDEEIKIYKNPTTRSYLVNNSSVEEHWASPYVTLLARLNMTDLTERNKDLRLDETITRAEVAQLVNFYLFRAPAEVDSKTKSGFSDVNKKHKLFADIIEATRDAHTYTLTVDGTEVAVED